MRKRVRALSQSPWVRGFAAAQGLSGAVMGGRRAYKKYRAGKQGRSMRMRRRRRRRRYRRRPMRRKRARTTRYIRKPRKFFKPSNRKFGPIETNKVISYSQVLECDKGRCQYYNFSTRSSTQLLGLMRTRHTATTGGIQSTSLVTEFSELKVGEPLNMPMAFMNKEEFHFVNNYNYPAKLTLYEVTPRYKTSVFPINDIREGLDAMQGINYGDNDDTKNQPGVGATTTLTNIGYFASNSELFRKSWKILRKRSFRLAPGDKCMHTVNTGWQLFDKEWFRIHGQEFVRSKQRVLVIRIQGTIGHNIDGMNPGVGYLDAKVDMLCHETITTRIKNPFEVKRVFAIPTNQAGDASIYVDPEDPGVENNVG